jgi:outer membrane protein TolC
MARQFIFLLILLTAKGLVHAQALSLEDCIRLALQKNARLASAGCELSAAEGRVKEANSLGLPSVSLSAGASYAPITGLDPALTEGGEYAGLVEIKQTLYDGGAIRLNRQQAKAGRQQAERARFRTVAEVRHEVRQVYIDLLDARRQFALMQQSIEDLESYLTTVRALASGGAVPQRDVMKAEIQLQSERIALQDLNVAVMTATTRLLEPLGLPLDTTVTIQDAIALPEVPQNYSRNPDLAEFGAGIAATELEVKLAQKERAPVLSAFGRAGAWTSRNQLLELDAPHVFGYQAGLTLELPLWNWGGTTARIEQKIAARDARHADYEVLRRRLDSEYRTTSMQHHAAMEKLERLRENRQRAMEQYDLLAAQYAGGGIGALEVLDAHRLLWDIALQEEQTSSDVNRLRAQLLRLTGEPE